MKAFCFYSGRLENSVESFAKVDGAGDFSVLVRDEWTVLAEVEFFAQVYYHFDSSVVERDIALAGSTFEFADDDLSTALRSDAIALADFFYTALNVHGPSVPNRCLS